MYHGAQPSAIHPCVRSDLGPYIIPSKADTSRPAAPNFFVEGKSAQGRADVTKRQGQIDGAIGARAMHKLQNYRAAEPEHDNKAHSFSSTYHVGTSTLQHDPSSQASESPGEPRYHMIKLKGFDVTSDKETFVKGATAAISETGQRRTDMISLTKPTRWPARCLPSARPIPLRTARSTAVVSGSDISEDDEVTPVKRLRPSAPSPISYDSATGGDDRTPLKPRWLLAEHP
ncbi:hypothetical protein LTR47_011785 [Exophiala xenobiotica]|nr:hypothetical protein LTR41_011852 [Exophiala xenobiotica]KAK5218118.1 hypothetical protein LTR47_011785 [Exophiala xenobiotica]KAK5242761.1 hypothetical protein LTS06_011307 [Exophiala xenobiotica]KAK5357621.1 hypothetical protein LTS03_011517 [Exophiala xenobiotica]KAK5550573.1 hypothetical protein LTR46_011427 [Exophiala xenobiotica]